MLKNIKNKKLSTCFTFLFTRWPQNEADEILKSLEDLREEEKRVNGESELYYIYSFITAQIRFKKAEGDVKKMNPIFVVDPLDQNKC